MFWKLSLISCFCLLVSPEISVKCTHSLYMFQQAWNSVDKNDCCEARRRRGMKMSGWWWLVELVAYGWWKYQGCHTIFVFVFSLLCCSYFQNILSTFFFFFFYIFGWKYDYNNDTAWQNIRKKEMKMIIHSKLSERDAMCIYLIFELSVEIDFFFF